MLRTLSKTTLLAGILATSLCFGSVFSSQVWAQHHGACVTDCPTCGIGGVGMGCRGGMCAGAGARLGSLHDQSPNCRPRQYGQAELFHNYYVPGTCGGVPAQMYLAPQPVPPLVGHTFITYEPVMPHEMLYQHHRTYHRYYDNGRGMNRTHISWYRPPVRSAAGSVLNPLRIAR